MVDSDSQFGKREENLALGFDLSSTYRSTTSRYFLPGDLGSRYVLPKTAMLGVIPIERESGNNLAIHTLIRTIGIHIRERTTGMIDRKSVGEVEPCV